MSAQLQNAADNTDRTFNNTSEIAPLIGSPNLNKSSSRSHLKGSIAGVYSLSGGAAILLLTKLGGYLFDTVSNGAPFYMMAIFNVVLLVIGVGAGVYREVQTQRRSRIFA